MNNWTLRVGDMKLWQRLLLVGLTGAVPLFIVAMVLIKASYSGNIHFAIQEQRGVAFQRPLEQLLDLLPRYQEAAREIADGNGLAAVSLRELQRQIDRSMELVAVNYNGDLGRSLNFTDAKLASRQRGLARLSVLQTGWKNLKAAPPARAGRSPAASQLVASIRAMIAQTGDGSNLILDDDLDSYYLMDITVCALPQTQQRLSDLTLQIGSGLSASNLAQVATLAAIMQTDDENRIANDAQTSLSEDKNFYEISASLQKNLPPAVAKYVAADQKFLTLLNRVASGGSVPPAELEAAGWNARAESFRLWEVGEDELDQLLAVRIHALQQVRLRCYFVISLTLILAVVVMGRIIRSLLNAQYAEMLKTEEELRSKEARLRALGDNLPKGMVFQVLRELDGSMRFLYVSAGIERLNGLTAEAVLRDYALFENQILREDLPKLTAAQRESLVNLGTFTVVVRVWQSDGSIRWMELSCAVRRLPLGGHIWDGIETDITAQKQAEERIERLNRTYAVISGINQTIVHEKNMQTLLETACRIAVEKGLFRAAWIGFLDPRSNRVNLAAYSGETNDFLQKLKEYRDEEPRGTGPSATVIRTGRHVICNDIERDPLMAPWREDAIRAGYRSVAAFPIKVEGRPIGNFTIFAGTPGFFDLEELALLDEVALDISFALEVNQREKERRKTEDQLLWKTAFFEAQVDCALDGILVMGSDGKKIVQNQRMNELWKIPPDVANHPDKNVQIQFNARQTKNPEQFVERILHLTSHPNEISRDVIELADGKVLDRYSSPVRDKTGNHYGRIWTFRDITEQRRLEEQFRQSQKMEAVGQLAGGVAHDFNNILAAMMMQIYLGDLDETLSPKTRELLCELKTYAERATHLTRQLLAFSRRQVMQTRLLDLNVVVANVATMLRRLLGEDVRLQLSLGQSALRTRADSGMLDQVLLNLVINARDAMPSGGQLVIETSERIFTEAEAALIPDALPGPYVSFSVSDSGTGIAPENLLRIFEPFFTTKEPGKGTGLGLATVFGVVKQHGGALQVESKIGSGTTFRVHLPAAGTKGGPTHTEIFKAKPRKGTETILLVEDDSGVRVLTRVVLERHGYRVLEAPHGVEALRIWEQHNGAIHLLLTDIVMPEGIGGRDLAARLSDRNPQLRVIFTSGYSAEIAGRELVLREGQNFLQKPCPSDQMLETVRRCLDE